MKEILRIADEKSEAIQVCMASILIAASAVPLLLLAQYTVPFADDFFAPTTTRNMLEETVFFYLNWQGTYAFRFSDVFNFFLFWGTGAYPVSIVAVILIYFGAWFFAIRSVLVCVFSCKKMSGTLWVFAAVIFYFSNFLNLGETLFWLGGASVYTYPLSMLLFAIGFYVRTYSAGKTKRIAYTIIAALCLFWACGGTALIAAASCSVFLYCSLQSLIKKSNNRRITLILFGCCLAFALVNALAPGNFIRRTHFQSEAPISLIETVIESFYISLRFWRENIQLLFITPVFLALPCREIARYTEKKVFMLPPASFLFVFAAAVVCIFPAALGFGVENMVGVMLSPHHRYMITFHSIFFGAIVFTSVLICGWFWISIAPRLKAIKLKQKTKRSVSQLVVPIYVVILLTIALSHLPVNVDSMHTAIIVKDIRNGTLADYKRLYDAAFKYAANTDDTDITITLPGAYPLFFQYPPSPHDSNFSSNRMLADYLGLNSVSVEEYFD